MRIYGIRYKRGLSMKRTLDLFVGLFAIILSLASCKPVQHVRGNLVDLDEVKKIQVNKTTKAGIRDLLGPPSSQELFGQDAWYYIGDKVESKSFFDPKIMERVLLVVVFNKKGVVSSYEMKDLSHQHEIDVSKESTPVKGRDPSLLSELFGNIGRYSAPKRTAAR